MDKKEVAITVVLAATIYVWVSGMGKSGTTTPNIACTVDEENDKLIVVSADPGIAWADINYTVDPTGLTLTLPAGNVAAGDSISTSGGTSGTRYAITLIYEPTNTAIGTWYITKN